MIKKLSIILTIIALLQSCATIQKTYYAKNSISIFQNNKEIKVVNNKTINLDKKEFSLRFLIKQNSIPIKSEEFNYARVSFFTNKQAFLKVGNEKDGEHHCFTPGMSAATGEKGAIKNMAINIAEYDYKGHYALYYKEENRKTVNHISSKNNFSLLELPINKIKIDTTYLEMENIKMEELYIAFFIDKNYNNTIEEGELTKIILDFKL